MIQKATNISSDFRYFRLGQIAEQIETHTTVIEALHQRYRKQLWTMFKFYASIDYRSGSRCYQIISRHSYTQLSNNGKTTLNINDIIDTATTEINAVSYSAMLMDETTPDLAIHIFGTELERVVQSIIERMSTSTSIYWNLTTDLTRS